jgi:TPR repeat protein
MANTIELSPHSLGEECLFPSFRLRRAGLSEGPCCSSDAEVIDDCAICLEPMLGGLHSSSNCSLPCNHHFHSHCCHRLKMSSLRPTCPLCRAEFSLNGKELFEKGTQLYNALNESEPDWNDLPADEEQMMQEIISMWLESADMGEAASMFNLGLISRLGRGVVQDNTAAFKWFENAAGLGHSDAQNNLGFMFSHGVGTELNYEQAAKWYHLASHKGNRDAQFGLALLYENGWGVAKSQINAHRWCSIASLSGCTAADVALERLNKKIAIRKAQKAKKDKQKLIKSQQSQSHSKSRYLIINSY